MTLANFRKTPLAIQVVQELNKIKARHAMAFKPDDLLGALFFSYYSITENVKMSDEIENNFLYYIKNYNEILKYMLVNYFAISPADYTKWVKERYDLFNALKLSQPCGLLTPTNRFNKDLIH